MALLEMAAVLGLFPVLPAAFRSYTGTILVLPIAGLYAWRWMLRFKTLTRTLEQLRIDEIFLAQNLNIVQLRQCLQRQDHIWSRSLVLEGLRGVLAHPLPRLLMPEERAERLRIYFRRVFAPVRPSRLHMEWVLPPAGFVLCLVSAGASALQHPVSLQIAVVLLATFMTLVVLQISSLQRIRVGYDSLERSLADWTLNARLSSVMLDRHKLYAHSLLYEAQPWFHARKEGTEAKP